jgi:hypothetical protein
MASPLQFHGGFQVTGNPSGTSALLRFKSKTFQVLVDTVYNQDISIQFGGRNLAFTGNYIPAAYNLARMFIMF